MGYQACLNASTKPAGEGNVGAGCGASVGKILGMAQAMKSGIGSASIDLGGVIVGALAVVNAFGDVVDPDTGQIIAGARQVLENQGNSESSGVFSDTMKIMQGLTRNQKLGFASGENTVIGVVATNALLSKEQANKMAQMAQDGLARAIRPAHTMVDGDTIFALSIGKRNADINVIGAFAAEAFAQAVLRAVRAAQPAGGLPGLYAR
jgi:L-aminopeptidase/D-esterase-like protein